VKLFGTHVLSGITHEGRIVLVQNYKFSSEMKCREASAKLEASYGPTSIAAEVSTAMKQIDTKSEMDVYYYQDCVNLKAVKLSELFSLEREVQLKGLDVCLGAFDSTGCPITIRWLTSLRDVPEIKSMMLKKQLPGLEDELQKQEKLASERSRVAKWLEEAVVTRDELERIHDVRVHDLKVDSGTRAEDFAKSVAAAQNWLDKPVGKAPELPSTKITKADVEGAIIQSKGWAFGQFHQHQVKNKGGIVVEYRVAPVINVLMLDLVSKVVKVCLVNEKNQEYKITMDWKELNKFRALAELIDRRGNKAGDTTIGYNSIAKNQEGYPYHRHNIIANTPGQIFKEEGKKDNDRVYNTDRNAYDQRLKMVWVKFADDPVLKSKYILQFTDKWGNEHEVKLGDAMQAPGLAEAEKLHGSKGRSVLQPKK
jgi:hypothetical protein